MEDPQVSGLPGFSPPQACYFGGGLLDETVALEIEDPWNTHAASIIVGSHLSPLLKPAPQDMSALQQAQSEIAGNQRSTSPCPVTFQELRRHISMLSR